MGAFFGYMVYRSLTTRGHPLTCAKSERSRDTDPEENEPVAFNDDDEQARRILSLALEFMNSRQAVSSTRIAQDIYPGLTPDSFRKAFLRDRKSLEDIGITLESERRAGGEAYWTADDTASFAEGTGLGVEDALVIDLACQPLLGDPEFPLRDELRFALAKIDTAFGDVSYPAGQGVLHDDKIVSTLRSCARSCHAVRMTYTDAAGRSSERTIAPFGFYGIRGSLYLVAPRVEEGAVVDGSTRVYNVARVSGVREVTSVSFSVPSDFSIESYRQLPFQLGPVACEATFEVPAAAAAEIERLSMGRGRFSMGEKDVTWTVDASNVGDTASWAIANGLRPIAPKELVDEWSTRLEGAIARVR